jgi:anti-sigma B factor antagonist
VLGVGDEILRDVVNELLAEDWKKIVLNLRKVTIIDSSGIGEVVASWKLAKRFGASLKLMRPAPQIQRTLRLTQLLPLLEVFESEEEAVASFPDRLIAGPNVLPAGRPQRAALCAVRLDQNPGLT